MHVYPYSRHLEAHCPASFGDREQKCKHRKAGMTVALQIRFIRGMTKMESPKELAVPDLRKANACSTRFGREGCVAKDGPDRSLIDIPWLGACPVPDPPVARKGCQGGLKGPQSSPSSPNLCSLPFLHCSLQYALLDQPFLFFLFPVGSIRSCSFLFPLIPFCLLTSISLPNPASLP